MKGITPKKGSRCNVTQRGFASVVLGNRFLVGKYIFCG